MTKPLFTLEQKGLSVIVECHRQGCIPDDIAEKFHMIKGDTARKFHLDFRHAREAEFGCGFLTYMLRVMEHEIAMQVATAVKDMAREELSSTVSHDEVTGADAVKRARAPGGNTENA